MKATYRKAIQMTFLIMMFLLMCVIKVWFAIFLFMVAGILMTLFQKRRIYCGFVCPMGTLSEWTGQDQQRELRIPPLVKIIVFLLFFAVLSLILWNFWGTNWLLWLYLLRFTIAIAVFSILSQLLFKKRTWCTGLCPIGRIQSFSSSRLEVGPEVEVGKCTNCMACTKACPLPDAISPPHVIKVDTKECLQCHSCEVACKYGAIKWKKDGPNFGD